MSLSYDGSLLYCFGGSAERVRVGVVAVTIAILIAVIVYVASRRHHRCRRRSRFF